MDFADDQAVVGVRGEWLVASVEPLGQALGFGQRDAPVKAGPDDEPWRLH